MTSTSSLSSSTEDSSSSMCPSAFDFPSPSSYNNSKLFSTPITTTALMQSPPSSPPSTAGKVHVPSGPREQGEGVEDAKQDILDIIPIQGGARVRITILASGFVIGPEGSSILEICHISGATISSHTLRKNNCTTNNTNNTSDGRCCREFVIHDSQDQVALAIDIISAAVERYKYLCEGACKGKFASREQAIAGMSFTYFPPPKSAMPQAARVKDHPVRGPRRSVDGCTTLRVNHKAHLPYKSPPQPLTPHLGLTTSPISPQLSPRCHRPSDEYSNYGHNGHTNSGFHSAFGGGGGNLTSAFGAVGAATPFDVANASAFYHNGNGNYLGGGGLHAAPHGNQQTSHATPTAGRFMSLDSHHMAAVEQAALFTIAQDRERRVREFAAALLQSERQQAADLADALSRAASGDASHYHIGHPSAWNAGVGLNGGLNGGVQQQQDLSTVFLDGVGIGGLSDLMMRAGSADCIDGIVTATPEYLAEHNQVMNSVFDCINHQDGFHGLKDGFTGGFKNNNYDGNGFGRNGGGGTSNALPRAFSADNPAALDRALSTNNNAATLPSFDTQAIQVPPFVASAWE